MKKVSKLIAGIVLAASVAVTAGALVGCGESEQTYKGEYSYENSWTPGKYYGVKVSVTVKGDKIVKVETVEAPDNWSNFSSGWTENAHPGDLGEEKAKAGFDEYLKKFEGKTVDEVLALKVSKSDKGEPNTDDAGDASQGAFIYTGATQTSGRVILAVQDALADIK